MRTVEWDNANNCLLMIDQRLLPGELSYLSLTDHHQVAAGIRDMAVRGAPAIGATAAFGLALAAQNSTASDVAALQSDLHQAAEVLQASRPTAVNLNWAVQRCLEVAARSGVSTQGIRESILALALQIADEDIQINKRMARHGAELIDDGDTVIHHCNTGALAAVDWGTALGVLRFAHEAGKRVHVLVDETRPRLQGARLTAWELEQYGMSYEIITDNSAGYFLRSGIARKVIFGADRMAANGDVANKIGTYMLALAAFDNSVPAYCVLPVSTVDLSLPDGEHIPIEERSSEEVLDLQFGGRRAAPAEAQARNPAFDITPARLITAIVTEHGVITPPFGDKLQRAVHEKMG